ncbi:hypothetical protein [Leptothermofonsia sp. ETS-13]|uniref:hypothetical protein n=1 Tax=Leptothermofonsia sp. ETS-13 TaxID=3035696 RepID=UPI003BA1E3E8
MNADLSPTHLFPEAYLETELTSSVRHEYRNGLTYAMVVGSDAHVRIGINLVSALNSYLRGKWLFDLFVGYEGHIQALNIY